LKTPMNSYFQQYLYRFIIKDAQIPGYRSSRHLNLVPWRLTLTVLSAKPTECHSSGAYSIEVIPRYLENFLHSCFLAMLSKLNELISCHCRHCNSVISEWLTALSLS
jgi:hypothetical protein